MCVSAVGLLYLVVLFFDEMDAYFLIVHTRTYTTMDMCILFFIGMIVAFCTSLMEHSNMFTPHFWRVQVGKHQYIHVHMLSKSVDHVIMRAFLTVSEAWQTKECVQQEDGTGV